MYLLFFIIVLFERRKEQRRLVENSSRRVSPCSSAPDGVPRKELFSLSPRPAPPQRAEERPRGRRSPSPPHSQARGPLRPAPLLPATGEGLRSTSHLLFHCNERQKDSVSQGRGREERALFPSRGGGVGRRPPARARRVAEPKGHRGARTFFPSLNLT